MTTDKNTLSADDKVALLALWRCPSVGPVRFRQILSSLSTPSQLLDPALAKDLSQLLPSAAKDQLTHIKLRADLIAKAESDWCWGEQTGQSIFFEQCPGYPLSLQPFSDSPPVLFTKGETQCLALPQVAVVGTRHPTVYGREQTKSFTQGLVSYGFSITSGLALGIDALAHEAALIAGGKTVAVLAHGLDQVYPRTHTMLARRIIEGGGLLVSEFPLATGPRKHYFPRRNRIMSALSHGVLVVEAAIRSGSLITARLASAQGKDVFAIPGSVQNVLSRGCHQLIREGAYLVETVKDTLEILQASLAIELQCLSESCDPRPQLATGLDATQKEEVSLLNPVQRQILAALDFAPSTMDTLVCRTQLTPQALLTELMVMELRALVRTVPGGYQRV